MVSQLGVESGVLVAPFGFSTALRARSSHESGLRWQVDHGFGVVVLLRYLQDGPERVDERPIVVASLGGQRAVLRSASTLLNRRRRTGSVVGHSWSLGVLGFDMLLVFRY
jgi:hypothetical protein